VAKMTKKGQNFVSDEISHLMKEGPSKGPQKDKKMPQKQAIAVALDVARRKGFKSAPNPNESFEYRGTLRLISERVLSARGRKQIKKGNFATPAKAPGSGSYPIHDIAHARNALARVSQHGSPAEKKTVEAAVYKKYPGLKDRKDEAMSIFDGIIGAQGRSLFDGIAENRSTRSLFDGIVESSPSKGLFDGIVENSTQKSEADNWDNRVARTLNLADELNGIRSSVKS